jgi:hypothetical protein
MPKSLNSIYGTHSPLGVNNDLTNYGQKKSIINIQDLGLSAASQRSIGG